MTTPSESRAALKLVSGAAVNEAVNALKGLDGSPSARKAALLEGIPSLIGYYSDGTSALAADFYDDQRELAAPPRLFVAEPIVPDREEKIFRALTWAADPLFAGGLEVASSRLADVVQLETARAYRETIVTNRKRDPSAVGWRRVTAGGCNFCRMLADRGAVYTDETALFASHTNCNCTAQPVFTTDDYGDEADVMQYLASKKRRTPEQRARLREYLDAYY